MIEDLEAPGSIVSLRGETMALQRSSILCAVLAILFLSNTGGAQDAPSSLLKKEAGVHKKVSDELVKLAKGCSKNKDYIKAEAYLRKALLIAPGQSKPAKELRKIQGKTGAPSERSLANISKLEDKAHKNCAKLLKQVALDCEKKGCGGLFEKNVTLIKRNFPDGIDLSDMKLVFFEPYLKWVREDAAARLKKGEERINGKWTSFEKVQELNQVHKKWSNPWEFNDGVHELRTTMPFRTAQRIMAQITAFRKFFLSQFIDAWDLQEPLGLLPVIVTASQAELKEFLIRDASVALANNFRGAAMYRWTNAPLNPCYLTFEPLLVTGKTIKADFNNLKLSIRHELSHQIAYEYSKHDSDDTRRNEHHVWVIEALANFMQNYDLGPEGWTLSHDDKINSCAGYSEGDFAYSVRKLETLPSLEDFFRTPREQMGVPEKYHMAGTIAYFLLKGQGGRYRKPYVSLLETVHKVTEDQDSYKKTFKGVSFSELQKQWEEFVQAIPVRVVKIDNRPG